MAVAPAAVGFGAGGKVFEPLADRLLGRGSELSHRDARAAIRKPTIRGWCPPGRWTLRRGRTRQNRQRNKECNGRGDTPSVVFHK